MPDRILVVDDEPGLRDAVQAYLEDSGFDVMSAANAPQALQMLKTKIPDLIISDIMMPGVDGFQFLQQLRQQDAYQTIPVIFLTARGLTADRIQGYRSGVDAYLPKPFDPDELVAIAQNLIARSHALTPPVVVARELHAIRELIEGKSNPTAGSTPTSTFQPATPPIHIELTPGERRVLEKVSEGLMNKEIAKHLQTSVRNVEKYVTRLLTKTGTSSRTELVRYALTYGLVKL